MGSKKLLPVIFGIIVVVLIVVGLLLGLKFVVFREKGLNEDRAEFSVANESSSY